MLTFRQIRKFLAPRWLTEEDGELLGYSLDLMKDAFVERARLGQLIRFPQQDGTGTPAPDDALAAMGRDRRTIKGIRETSAHYATRLLTWLDDRRTAGNAFALMQQLAAYTGPGPAFRTVDARGNWYSRAADGTTSFTLNTANWLWDGTTGGSGAVGKRWSRFWVIIYPNGLWVPGPDSWGTGPDNWGDAATETWGSTASPDEVADIRAIVEQWKPGGTRCVNIIIAFNPASFDPAAPEPDGLWGRWSKVVNGVRVPSRLATARYWDGV